MKNILIILKKKTTWVALLFLAAFILAKVYVGFEVKPWLYGILSSLGLAAFRLALQKVSGNKGWKSYASAVIVFAASVLNAVGVVVSPETLEIVFSLCTVLGLVGVRDAVNHIKNV